MIRRYLQAALIGFILVQGGSAGAQVRFNPKAGLATWSFRDERAIYGTSHHPGQSITAGFSIPLKKGALFTGLSLQRFTVEDQPNALGIEDGPHFTYFLVPLHYVHPLYARPDITLSLLGGGDLMIFYDLDDNPSGLESQDMRSVVPRLNGGVQGVFFGHLTLDLHIRFGLVNMIYLRDESTARSFSMEIGWMF